MYLNKIKLANLTIALTGTMLLTACNSGGSSTKDSLTNDSSRSAEISNNAIGNHEWCKAPAKPYVDWHECLKSEEILINAFLTGAKLDNAILYYAMLTDAILVKANLPNADLEHAYLDNANLTDAKLINAKLNYVNLNNAILTKADLN